MTIDSHQDQTSPSSSSSTHRRIFNRSPISCFVINKESSDDHTASSSNDSDSDTSSTNSTRSSSSSGWSKSRTSPIKDKCTTFISKFGRRRRRVSRHTADFSYDAKSYALNFDDEAASARFNDDDHDDVLLRNFSYRLSAAASEKRSLGCVESICAVSHDQIIGASS